MMELSDAWYLCPSLRAIGERSDAISRPAMALVISHALGQSVRFEAGKSPRLDPISRRKQSMRCREPSIEACWRRSTKR
jgi:hypothetical protein